MRSSRPLGIVSPDDQKVTFVELFFDLVFVFCVTQVAALLASDLTWSAAGHATLVFWLVWWAWTQFTWALNAADTTHPGVSLGTLVATAVAFFMAIAIPDAFGEGAYRFAVPYVLIRIVGLTIYARVAREADAMQHTAVRVFATASVGGLAAVLIGALLGGAGQYALWGAAILLDVLAASVGGRQEGWNIHPEHFAERHALFVIIALGEGLIVAASAVSGDAFTGERVPVALLAVAVTCALWWSYFPHAKPRLDRALESTRGSVQSELARDAFSLIHFPMISGIVGYAAALHEAIAHPAEPLQLPVRLALGVGLVLFLGGMGIALWRAGRRLPKARILIGGATAIVIVAVPGLAPSATIGIALAGVTAIAALEELGAEG